MSNKRKNAEVQVEASAKKKHKTQNTKGDAKKSKTQNKQGDSKKARTQNIKKNAKKVTTQNIKENAEKPNTEDTNGDTEKPKTQNIIEDAEQSQTHHINGDSDKAETQKQDFSKKNKFSKKLGPGDKNQSNGPEKPEDWNAFKKKKKELKLQRKQNKSGFDVVVRAKKIGEKLRRKTLKGGDTERNALINELHLLLKQKGHYPKFVFAHDTSRIVQWLLKYSWHSIKNEITQELLPVVPAMLTSKYGVFCVKTLLKYGAQETKGKIVARMYGSAVKLATHSVSARMFDYAYTNCTSPRQKKHLMQEFYGEIYRTSKDDSLAHLRDVFRQSPGLKSATLSAVKSHLTKIMNKNLLDSALVQTIIKQYLEECSGEHRAELISQLVPHIVVISNSKDGARAAMQCIWHGTNKDRKVAMKTIKEHVLEMSKHQHAYWTVIALLETADDTVMLHKIIVSEILKSARDLATNEWGRKVLMWLVAPADYTCFHPEFVNELENGRKQSNAKKDTEIRRKEILTSSIDTLLDLLIKEPEFWLKSSSLAYEMFLILKAGSGEVFGEALQGVLNILVQADWKIECKGAEIAGVEDAGIHMVLKKMAKQVDGFNSCLADALTDEIVLHWIKFNRGCFFLATVYENSPADVQEKLKSIMGTHRESLKAQTTAGAKILLQKVDE